MSIRRASARSNPDSPRPGHIERRSDFIKRFMTDRWVKTTYPTPAKATLAAEKEWARAKTESIISVTTFEDQFLMFY